MPNYYEILGVNSSSSQAEIKAAYLKLAFKYHPDKNRGTDHEIKIANEEKFKDIANAFELLSNEDARKTYDQSQNFTDRMFSWFWQKMSASNVADNFIKKTGKCFIVYTKLYVVGDEKNVKGLDLNTYLNFFFNGFPLPLFPLAMVKHQSFIYSELELEQINQRKYYEKESWKQLDLPDCISRYVIELSLSKETVEHMFNCEMIIDLNQYIVSAREDKLSRKNNIWEKGEQTQLLSHTGSTFKSLNLF